MSLGIAAKTKSTKASATTPIVAPTTMTLVEGRVDTLAIATNLVVLALLPTLPAVSAVAQQVDTLLLAAVGARAALGATNPRSPLARQMPSLLRNWPEEIEAVVYT